MPPAWGVKRNASCSAGNRIFIRLIMPEATSVDVGSLSASAAKYARQSHASTRHQSALLAKNAAAGNKEKEKW